MVRGVKWNHCGVHLCCGFLHWKTGFEVGMVVHRGCLSSDIDKVASAALPFPLGDDVFMVPRVVVRGATSLSRVLLCKFRPWPTVPIPGSGPNCVRLPSTWCSKEQDGGCKLGLRQGFHCSASHQGLSRPAGSPSSFWWRHHICI